MTLFYAASIGFLGTFWAGLFITSLRRGESPGPAFAAALCGAATCVAFAGLVSQQ